MTCRQQAKPARNWGIPPRDNALYPPGCDWMKPPGCACNTIAQAQSCYERCDDDTTYYQRKAAKAEGFAYASLLFFAALLVVGVAWLVGPGPTLEKVRYCPPVWQCNGPKDTNHPACGTCPE